MPFFYHFEMQKTFRGEELVGVPHIGRIIASSLLLLAFLIGLPMWGCPVYNVWQQGLEGQAELERARQNRQIRIQEAEAQKESATLLAAAEVERAKGVAQANQIIGDSLRENEQYLRYLWIQGLQDGNGEVIYVPTEANLPILEAGRFNRQSISTVGGE